MKNEIIRYSQYPTVLYPAQVISHLAGVSLRLLYECEYEGLIQGYDMPGGIRCYRIEDVHQLALVRRLRNDLELELAAVEIVLNMRQQMKALHAELQTIQQRAADRERELLDEIRRLSESISSQ